MVAAEAASAAAPVSTLRRLKPPPRCGGSGKGNEVVMIFSHGVLFGEKKRPAFRHKAGETITDSSSCRPGVRGLSSGRRCHGTVTKPSDRIPVENVRRAIELVERRFQRWHAVLGDRLRRPAFAAVHRA